MSEDEKCYFDGRTRRQLYRCQGQNCNNLFCKDHGTYPYCGTCLHKLGLDESPQSIVKQVLDRLKVR